MNSKTRRPSILNECPQHGAYIGVQCGGCEAGLPGGDINSRVNVGEFNFASAAWHQGLVAALLWLDRSRRSKSPSAAQAHAVIILDYIDQLERAVDDALTVFVDTRWHEAYSHLSSERYRPS